MRVGKRPHQHFIARGRASTRSFASLKHLHHRSGSRREEFSVLFLEVVDDLLNDFAEFLVDLNWIVAVDSGDEVGTFADVDLILVAPLHPAMIGVDWLHPLPGVVQIFTNSRIFPGKSPLHPGVWEPDMGEELTGRGEGVDAGPRHYTDSRLGSSWAGIEEMRRRPKYARWDWREGREKSGREDLNLRPHGPEPEDLRPLIALYLPDRKRVVARVSLAKEIPRSPIFPGIVCAAAELSLQLCRPALAVDSPVFVCAAGRASFLVLYARV